MQWQRDGIQHRMVRPQPEITVAPDRFEVTADDVVLVTELRSAIAVCITTRWKRREPCCTFAVSCAFRSPRT
jgi:hypothetical protein